MKGPFSAIPVLLFLLGAPLRAVDIEFSEAPPKVVDELGEPAAGEEPVLFGLSLDYHTRLSYYDIKGDTSRAIKRQGYNYVQDLTLRLDRPVVDGIFVEGEAQLRHVEDPRLLGRGKRRQLNQNRLRFEQGFLALYHPDRFRAEVGDVLVNYNRYVLSRNLTVYPAGEFYVPVGEGRLRTSGLFGEEPEEQVFGTDRRQVAGARVALEDVHPILRTLGSTISWSNDKDPQDGGITNEGYVWGFDGEVATPLEGLDVYWDFARSRYGQETQGQQGTFQLFREMAWRGGTRYTTDFGLVSNVEYEEVQPEFRTVLGSAAPDTRSYRASVQIPLPENVDWTLLYQFTQNNVDDKQPDTLFLQNGSADVRYRPLGGDASPALDSFTLSAGYSVNVRNTEKKAVRSQNDGYRTGVSIEEVWGFDFSATYQRLEDRDYLSDVKRHGNRTTTRVGYTWLLEQYDADLRPFHEFRYQDTQVGGGEVTQDTGYGREYIWGLDTRFLQHWNTTWSYALRFDDLIGGGNSGKEDRYRGSIAYSPELPFGHLRVGLDFRYSDVDADDDANDYRDWEGGVTLDYGF